MYAFPMGIVLYFDGELGAPLCQRMSNTKKPKGFLSPDIFHNLNQNFLWSVWCGGGVIFILIYFTLKIKVHVYSVSNMLHFL